MLRSLYGKLPDNPASVVANHYSIQVLTLHTEVLYGFLQFVFEQRHDLRAPFMNQFDGDLRHDLREVCERILSHRQVFALKAHLIGLNVITVKQAMKKSMRLMSSKSFFWRSSE